VREALEDVGSLVVEGRAADLDEAGVVGPAVETKLPQPGRIERHRRLGIAGVVAFSEAPHGRVFIKDHHDALVFTYANIT
jgi:hypothetical protein